jgi:subtilisin family serine protease
LLAGGLDSLAPLTSDVSRQDIPSGVLEDPNISSIQWRGRTTYVYKNEWIAKFDSSTETVRESLYTASMDLAGIPDQFMGPLSQNTITLQFDRSLNDRGTFAFSSTKAHDPTQLKEALEKEAAFEFLEPNFVVWTDAIPNDTSFDELWGLHNTGQTSGTDDADIDAPEAWDISAGTGSTVIGVIDTGIDYTHPDLEDNIWVNPIECPDGIGACVEDGVDDDGNGFIDDFHGYDFANEDNDPFDDNSHGTHVAGTIGAVGDNNLGVSGVNPNAKVMALKFLSGGGFGNLQDAVEAVEYSTRMKRDHDINIIATNNSWGGGGFSQALYDAIEAAGNEGQLFIAAAGNSNNNNDNVPSYPSGYDLDNIISVAATDHNDNRAGFSSFGATTVDLGAPGVDVLSTTPNNTYQEFSGTSMASPQVAGAVALIADTAPEFTIQEIKEVIMNSTDPVDDLDSITVTGGRLNLLLAMEQLGMRVRGSTPANNSVIFAQPSNFVIEFSDPFLVSSIQTSDLNVNGTVPDSMTLTDTDTVTFHFNSTPIVNEGLQTLDIAEAAVIREEDNDPLDVFHANFRYDSLELQVVSTTPVDQSNNLIPFSSVLFQFNEPIDPASLDLSDLILSQGVVANVAAIGNDAAEFTLSGIDTEGTLEISLAAGNVTDVFGNPNAAYANSYELDFGVAPYPTPLEPKQPLGSLIYDPVASGRIGVVDDVDQFTIELDANQTISIQSTAETDLQTTIEVFDPANTSLGSVTANASGETTILQSLPVGTSGTYTIAISSANDTIGDYQTRLYLNSAFESEDFGGAVNDTRGTAEDIDASGIDVGFGSSRLGVIGSRDDGGDDWYSFTLADGQGATLLATSQQGGSPSVDLYDDAGVHIGVSSPSQNVDAVVGPFVDPTTDILPATYYARIFGGSGSYSLVVAIDAGFDRERNGLVSSAQILDPSHVTLGYISNGALPLENEAEPNDDGVAGGTTDDFPFANDLSGSFLPVGGSQFTATVTGEISNGSDVDWDFFRFQAAPGNTLDVELRGSGSGNGSLGDPYLRLYDIDGTQIALNDDFFGLESFISYSAFDYVGDYFLVADSFGSNTGSYRMFATLTTDSPPSSNDDDAYSFIANSGDELVVETITPGDGNGQPPNVLDPRLELYDPNGNLVASDDNSATDGRNALLSHSATENGIYTAIIVSADGRGEYLLRASGSTANSSPFSVSASDPLDGARFSNSPAEITLDFNGDILVSSLATTDLLINGAATATNHQLVDANTVVFELPSLDANIDNIIELPAASLSNLQGQQLEAFSTTIVVDTIAPRISSLSIQQGDLIPVGDTQIVVGFNESLNVSDIDPSDIILTGELGGPHAVSSFSYDEVSDTLTIQFESLADDNYNFRLTSGNGGFEDLVGNDLDGEATVFPLPPNESGDGTAGGDFVFGFTADVVETDLATPLVGRGSLGNQLYETSTFGQINFAGDKDTYAVSLNDGQIVSIGLQTIAGLEATLRLLDPSDGLVAEQTTNGGSALIQTIPLSAAGEYTIEVEGANGSTGAYVDLHLILSAAFESESYSGSGNNSLNSAQDLSAALAPTAFNANLGSVIGTSDPPASGLVGRYYVPGGDVTNFPDFEQLTPVHTRIESSIAYPSQSNGFAGYTDISTHYAVQWLGEILIETSGTYTFFTESDDGSQLLIDGVQVVDNSGGHSMRERSGTIDLDAGYHDFQIDYWNGVGGAGIFVSYQPPNENQQIIEGLFSNKEIGLETVSTSFVPQGAEWQYLDDGSDQQTAWREFAFDDSSWSMGRAHLGYGENDQTTTVGFGPDSNQRYATTYFRHTFNVSQDPTTITELQLHLLRDDGAAVYLNGIEIDRDNLVNDALFDRFADSAVTNQNEDTFFLKNIDLTSLPVGTLRAGENVLAVEIHQSGPRSSDISFDLRLESVVPVSSNQDWYQFQLADGESTTLLLNSSGSGGATLELYDSAGTLLSSGVVSQQADHAIKDFCDSTVDVTPDTYYAKISNVTSPYELSIARNAAFDSKPNDSLETAQPLPDSGIVVGHLRGNSQLTSINSIPSDGNIDKQRPPIDFESEHVAGEMLVRFASNIDATSFASIAADLGGEVTKELSLIDAAVVRLTDATESLQDAVHRWDNDERILYAEPNYIVRTVGTPNDVDFAELWGLHNTGQTTGLDDADIDATEAWDLFTGSHDVVIASIDTGVDYTHEDLVDNIWTNPVECPQGHGLCEANGVDEDGNGYVDDFYGIDTFNSDADPFDDHSHGTHTAGTFGAVGDNGIGIAGVNWNVDIMSLKFLGAAGFGSIDDAVELVLYMTAMKTRAVEPVNLVVSNNSWGGGGFSQAMQDAIQASNDAGIMFVAAAGNSGSDNDQVPSYPASYELDGVIAVAATDHNDELAGFSQYGLTSVDLAAPGVDVYSTTPGDNYAEFSGTSMASPHVAGATALLMAFDPTASLAEVKDALIVGTDPLPALDGITVAGGRLNLSASLTLMGDPGDFFSFSGLANNTVTITTATPSDGAFEFTNLQDPALELLDSAGNLLAADFDSAADGKNALLTHQLPADGTYFIRVMSPDGAGEYELQVSGNYEAITPAFEVATIAPEFQQILGVAPTEIVIRFNDTVLMNSLEASDLLIDGQPANSFTVIDGQTIAFQVTGLTEGIRTVTFADGALDDIQGTPLTAFTSEFELDFTGPRIVGTSLQQDDTHSPGDLTISLTFDETIAAASVVNESFTMTGAFRGTFSPASIVHDQVLNTVEILYHNLPEDNFTFGVVSGGIEDLVGNDLDGEAVTFPIGPNQSGDGTPGGNFIIAFSLDVTVQPLDSMERIEPLGSMVSAAFDQPGLSNTNNDIDTYQIYGLTGSTIIVSVSPVENSSITIEIPGVAGPITAAAGESVLISATPIASNGMLDLLIQGSSVGTYTFDVIRNATIEFSDSTESVPLNIDNSRLVFGHDRFAVVGSSTPYETTGSVIYAIQPASQSLLTIDSLTGEVVGIAAFPHVATDSTDMGLAYDRVNDRLLYTNTELDAYRLFYLDPATGEIIGSDTIPTGDYDGLGLQNGDVVQPIYFANMDQDPGWTLDEGWEYGAPQGVDGDPFSGATDANVIGYNLAGAYENGMPERFASSPSFDTTGFHDVQLSFQRWLGIESDSFDHASVEVSIDNASWTTVWQHEGSALIDSEWILQEFDISEVADNQPEVYLRWKMGTTDGSGTYSGWNIDDVVVSGIFDLPDSFYFNDEQVIAQEGPLGVQSTLYDLLPTANAIGADDGLRVFVNVPGTGIVELDPVTPNTVINTFVAPAVDIEGLSFDGTTLTAATANGALFVLNPDTGAVLQQTTISGGGVFALASRELRTESTQVVADLDVYQFDLTGKVGEQLDVILSSVDRTDLKSQSLELLAPNGEVIATAIPDPFGMRTRESELAIVNFTVPTDGVYSLKFQSTVAADYTIAVSSSLALELERNDTTTIPVRNIDGNEGVRGYLGPNNALVFATTNNGEISQLDVSTGETLNSFPVPAPESGIASMAVIEDRVFYLDYFGREVFELDSVTGEVVDSDTLQDMGINGFAKGLAALGDRLAVYDVFSNEIHFVDVDADTSLGSITPEFFGFGGLAGAGDRGTLFAGSGFDTTIYEISAATGQTVNSFQVSSGNFNSLAYDGGLIYMSNQSQELLEIDPDTAEILNTAPLGSNVISLGGDDSSGQSPFQVDSADASQEFDNYFPASTFIAPQSARVNDLESPENAAINYLTANADDFGLTTNDIVAIQVVDSYQSDSGISHVYLSQKINGLNVANAAANVNIAADGKIVTAGSSLISNVDSVASISTSPLRTADQAVVDLARHFKWQLDEVTITNRTGGAEQGTSLEAPTIANDSIEANLQYQPTSLGHVELAWRVNLQTADGEHWFDAAISDATGELLYLSDWASNAVYQIYAHPLESPSHGNRTSLLNPFDAVASPFGWHDTDGVVGSEFTTTQGNNAFAYADRDGDNQPDVGSVPNGNAQLDFRFGIDLQQQPENNFSPAVTNLFYWTNLLHDIHYHYGFNEQAGNFQFDNYGNGGQGGDHVLAETQDGANSGKRNNATFFTPPDGQSGRMELAQWSSSAIERDGALDSGIIIHEYAHGVTTRLTGGPANSNSLVAIQSAGMGEGWSDFYALNITQTVNDTVSAGRGVGTYALSQAPTGAGIRTQPYSFDMNINTLTFADITSLQDSHDIGEVWAAALWDLNWLLIEGNNLEPNLPAPLGFDSDLIVGTGGNNLALQLVMDGLKLQPANPTFLDARDAILAADSALLDGANQLAIWTAFARRGMGYSAEDGGGADTLDVVEAFDLPSVHQGVVSLDADEYTGNDTVTVTVRDLHLVDSPSFQLTVTADSGESEVVTLSPISLGVFAGQIETRLFSTDDGDGLIRVTTGDQLTVTYEDLDDGSGNPVTVQDSADIAFAVVKGGDLYHLDLRVGDTVTLYTETPLDDPNGDPLNDLDPMIVLYEPNGDVAAEDLSSEPDGRNSRVVFTATEAGQYTIQVESEGGQGEYILYTEITPPGVELEFTSPTGNFTLAPGESMPITISITGIPSNFSTYQLNFLNSDIGGDQLALTNWITGASWAPLDGFLLTPVDTSIAGTGNPGDLPTEIGTFTVTAPASEGTFLVTVDYDAGTPDRTGFDALPILDFGDIFITVQENTPPLGELLTPGNGTYVSIDSGFVEITWLDLGDHSSGIAEPTIDLSDIHVIASDRVLSIDRVEAQGNGVWRYYYNEDGDQLVEGPIVVRINGSEVVDLRGNPNAETLSVFNFDETPPQVLAIDFNTQTVDPLDLPHGPQPSSWLQQKSEINDVRISFSEEVALTPADLVLTNLGVDADNVADIVVPLTVNHLTQSGTDWIITFAQGELADGAYQLVINPSLSDRAGLLLDGDGDGTGGDAFIITASDANGFYKLTSDFNGDRGVSVFDFSTFSYWFGTAVPAAPSYVDMNIDGGVSVFDFTLFSNNFGTGIQFPTGFAAAAVTISPDPKPITEPAEVDDVEQTLESLELPVTLAREPVDEPLTIRNELDTVIDQLAEELVDVLGTRTLSDEALEAWLD